MQMVTMKKHIYTGLKIAVVLFLCMMLAMEAFETSFYISNDLTVIYTAIITTLCWLLLGWLFVDYKKIHYIMLGIFSVSFLYLCFIHGEIQKAHEKQKNVETSIVEKSNNL